MTSHKRYILFIFALFGVAFLMGLVAGLSEGFIGGIAGALLAYLIFPALLAWIFYVRGYFSDVGFLELEVKLFEPYYDAPVKERYRIIGSVAILGLLPIVVTILLLPEFEYPWIQYFPVTMIGFAYIVGVIGYGAILFEGPRRIYNNYLAPIVILLFGPFIGFSSFIDYEYPYGWTETAILAVSYALMVLGAIGLLSGSRKIADKKAKSEAELEFAGEVQRKFLQTRKIENYRFSSYGSSVPARNLGGDFFNLEIMGESKLLGAVGDVSGHSYGAGLIMVMMKTVFEDHLEYHTDTELLLKKLSQKLYRQGERSMFCSFCCLEVDAEKREATLWNAGHMPVLHYKSETAELVQHHRPGQALGLTENTTCESETFSVDPGDILILYSDGLIETRDEKNQIREPEFFHDILREVFAQTDDPEAASDQIKNLVVQSDHAEESEDDMTLIVIRVK